MTNISEGQGKDFGPQLLDRHLGGSSTWFIFAEDEPSYEDGWGEEGVVYGHYRPLVRSSLIIPRAGGVNAAF